MNDASQHWQRAPVFVMTMLIQCLYGEVLKLLKFEYLAWCVQIRKDEKKIVFHDLPGITKRIW